MRDLLKKALSVGNVQWKEGSCIKGRLLVTLCLADERQYTDKTVTLIAYLQALFVTLPWLTLEVIGVHAWVITPRIDLVEASRTDQLSYNGLIISTKYPSIAL